MGWKGVGVGVLLLGAAVSANKERGGGQVATREFGNGCRPSPEQVGYINDAADSVGNPTVHGRPLRQYLKWLFSYESCFNENASNPAGDVGYGVPTGLAQYVPETFYREAGQALASHPDAWADIGVHSTDDLSLHSGRQQAYAAAYAFANLEPDYRDWEGMLHVPAPAGPFETGAGLAETDRRVEVMQFKMPSGEVIRSYATT